MINWYDVHKAWFGGVALLQAAIRKWSLKNNRCKPTDKKNETVSETFTCGYCVCWSLTWLHNIR